MMRRCGEIQSCSTSPPKTERRAPIPKPSRLRLRLKEITMNMSNPTRGAIAGSCAQIWPGPRPMSSPSAPRLKSIDVLRGATIAAMIIVNGQFSHEWSYLQLRHAAGSGWTFADTIFPCFLFIVGVSLTLSTASRVARGEDRTRLLRHAVRRSLLIFGCGVVIEYLRVPVPQFPFIGLQDHLQFRGTLQTIAVCYL